MRHQEAGGAVHENARPRSAERGLGATIPHCNDRADEANTQNYGVKCVQNGAAVRQQNGLLIFAAFFVLDIAA